LDEWHHAFDARPAGVTVLAILYLVNAAIAFTGIVALVYLATQIDFFEPYPLPGQAFAQPMIEPSSFMSMLTAGVSIVFGIIGGINVLIGIGLLKARRWARNLAIAFAIINIIIYSLAIPATVGASLAMVFFNGFILWYLYRPQVVMYFRR
jgi:hypothetical protein